MPDVSDQLLHRVPEQDLVVPRKDGLCCSEKFDYDFLLGCDVSISPSAGLFVTL